MRKLHVLTCQPSDLYFNWQVRVQLYNARKTNCSQYFRVLVFTPKDRLGEDLSHWKTLEHDFPETKFFYYSDDHNILKVIHIFSYIPLLRPYCLERHFKQYPELREDAIFYIDSDVLLHKGIDFIISYLQDDVVYMSDGKSYNNSDYFDSKVKDVLPYKLEAYKKIDVLDRAADVCGINRKICEEHKNSTGAAQYLLKNIDHHFFQELFDACCALRLLLSQNINKQYFESEEKGFQGWCADIYATNWLLWKRKIETSTPKDFDFCWATDKPERFQETNIYHDAGANGNKMFLKRKMDYVNNIKTPFQDDLSYVSKEYASWHYTQEITHCKNYFNL